MPNAECRHAGGIDYTLTRRRVRNLNLRVRADGTVAASAAPRVPAAAVDAFVAARAPWVRKAQARAAQRAAREAAAEAALPPKPEALAQLTALCRAYYPQFAASCPGGRFRASPCATCARGGVLQPQDRHAGVQPAAVPGAAARAGIRGGA